MRKLKALALCLFYAIAMSSLLFLFANAMSGCGPRRLEGSGELPPSDAPVVEEPRQVDCETDHYIAEVEFYRNLWMRANQDLQTCNLVVESFALMQKEGEAEIGK